MDLLEKLHDGILYFDGGLGSLLQARGLKSGQLPDAWNLERPDDVRAAHLEYLEAGADVINTNTFGSNRARLGDKLRETVEAGVRLAREAVNERGGGYVALDVGPTGKLLEPLGDLSFEDAVSLFAETVRIGAAAGADLVNIETMSDAYEAKAALIAAKESCSLPVFVSAAFNGSGKLLMGSDALIAGMMLEGLGADAVGLNCGVGPKEAKVVIEALSGCLSVPVIACPNAGLPHIVNGETVFNVGPDEFAEVMAELVSLGARVVGGCCGTTPAHIRALRKRTEKMTPPPLTEKGRTIVSSGVIACEFGLSPLLVGERINPTGRKAIAAAMRGGDMDAVVEEAAAQAEEGAHIIDVNAGLPEIDEGETLPRLVSDIQLVCRRPLQIDTVDIRAAERAMRIYNGRPLLNSVTGTKERMDAVLPLVKKYGAVVVALTLDEDGIPATAEGRLAVAEKIIAEAERYGIKKRDIVFDPLVLAAAADPYAAPVTLKAVSLIGERLGCKTMLGVSNVSYGLPERAALNAAMLTCALERGASSAFVNTASEDVMRAYRCFAALHGLDARFAEYIENARAEREKARPAPAQGGLYRSIVLGLSRDAAEDTRKMLESAAPMDIINSSLIPALDEIGRDYESGAAFLPQLLMSADAAKAAFGVISERMAASGAERERRGRIVLATVKGDVHDIGKNIVAVLLENYGFEVVDLGRDVSPERICDAVNEESAPVCGLSALMTTTVPAMRETVTMLRERAPGCLVIVGGAVLTQEYADDMGADGYSKDALGAVRLVERLLGK